MTIPFVMRGVGDPVGLGLVASLGCPGGNVTGLSYSVETKTLGKGLELLKDAVPEIQRVAILSNPTNPMNGLELRDLKGAARSLGLQLQPLEAGAPEAIDGAFAAVASERADAMFVVADSMFFMHRARLAELAVRNRLPSMYGNREAVEAGGLMSMGPTLRLSFGRPLSTWTRSSRALSPPSSLSNSRRSLNSLSTYKQRRHWA